MRNFFFKKGKLMPLTRNDPDGWFVTTRFFKILYRVPKENLREKLKSIITDDIKCNFQAEQEKDSFSLKGRKEFLNFWVDNWAKSASKRMETKLVSMNSRLIGHNNYVVEVTVLQKHDEKQYLIASEQYFQLRKVGDDFKIENLRMIRLSKEEIKT